MSMATFKHDIAIARPPDEVFDYIADPSRFADWQQGVTITPISGEPTDVGHRLRKVRKTPMGTIRLTLEVARLDRSARVLELRVLDGVPKGSTEVWSVEADATGSRVRLLAPTTWNGPARLLAPLLDRMADRQLASEFGHLKDRLER